MFKRIFLILLILQLSVLAPVAKPVQPLVVFAGSAAQPPLEEAVRNFEEKTGIPTILHLGGSGSILNQIRLTNQGDLYIPGSPDYMEKAKSFELIDGQPVPLAYLIPAIIVAKGNPQDIHNLQDLDRPGLKVGIADPRGVCVGLYAIELLETNGIIKQVQQNLHGLVESCAKTASMISLNLADAVIGWREFANWNPETMEAILFKPEQIPRLATIPAGILRNSKNKVGAVAFIEFMTSDEGAAIFNKWGYMTEEKDARIFAPMARIGGSYPLPEEWE